MKKLRALKAVAVLGLILSALALINGAKDTQQSSRSTLSPSQTVPPGTVTPTPTSTLPPTTQPTVGAKPARSATPTVVTVAATSLNILSTAILLPQVQMHSVISNLVVPELRKPLESTMTATGPQLVSVWGYSTVGAANIGANYSVEAQKYRIDGLNRTDAVISLFVVSHWVTSNAQDYRVPAITVIHLRMIKGNWLYASSSKPPSSQTPPSQPGLSFEQSVQSFQLYLKGWQSYGSYS